MFVPSVDPIRTAEELGGANRLLQLVGNSVMPGENIGGKRMSYILFSNPLNGTEPVCRTPIQSP